MRDIDTPGIRSGQLPPTDYALATPRLGLRLREQGWGCHISINGEWVPVSRIQFEAAASSSPPQVTITIPALDLTIETETQRAVDYAA